MAAKVPAKVAITVASRDTNRVVYTFCMMNADIVTGVSMCLLFVAFFNGWGSFAAWFLLGM